MTTDTREHWNAVWTSKDFAETSWYQADPTPSLVWIDRAITDGGSIDRVVDAGCGVSFLADRLLERGAEVFGIDVSAAAIDRLTERIRTRGENDTTLDPSRFHGVVCDLGRDDPAPDRPLGATIWHDRAVLHFLHGDARERYAAGLRRHLAMGGHAIIAGFAPEGPLKCSGLEVVRATADEIAALLGPTFTLVDVEIRTHRTPWDAEQAFQWTCLRRTPPAG